MRSPDRTPDPDTPAALGLLALGIAVGVGLLLVNAVGLAVLGLLLE